MVNHFELQGRREPFSPEYSWGERNCPAPSRTTLTLSIHFKAGIAYEIAYPAILAVPQAFVPVALFCPAAMFVRFQCLTDDNSLYR